MIPNEPWQGLNDFQKDLVSLRNPESSRISLRKVWMNLENLTNPLSQFKRILTSSAGFQLTLHKFKINFQIF